MIMDVAEVRAVLARTPSVLQLLVGGLAQPWLDSRPADGEWSAHQVICHLAYVEETDWLVRARMILEVGTARPFPPVEHGDQSDRYAGLSTGEVLDRFTTEREANLSAIGELDLSAAALERRGLHPTLGEVTLQQLMATWLVHDHNHVAQLQAALASHCVAEVGPWRSFLGILDRVER